MAEVDRWIVQLLRKEKLSVNDVQKLCAQAREVLVREPNVVHVQSPVFVCGDVHGQFEDMMKMFAKAGNPLTTNYVFLGDYVDRGTDSVECISMLLCLKVKFRERFVLLRGNHECRVITTVYGFYDECRQKYGSATVWRYFVDLFDFFPLCAIIDNTIMCVHGGLSPAVPTVDGIMAINRFREIPTEGALCDLVWSDPDNRPGWNLSHRKVSVTFGAAVSREFIRANDLRFIARAHEVVEKGYEWTHERKVVTIFSAPNYCNTTNNAAFMQVKDFHRDPCFHSFG